MISDYEDIQLDRDIVVHKLNYIKHCISVVRGMCEFDRNELILIHVVSESLFRQEMLSRLVSLVKIVGRRQLIDCGIELMQVKTFDKLPIDDVKNYYNDICEKLKPLYINYINKVNDYELDIEYCDAEMNKIMMKYEHDDVQLPVTLSC